MMVTDEISEPSSPDTPFDDTDLLNSAVTDDVTAQLAAAGPIGMAAAAAIATGKKRKRPHVFETNPSIRKRIQKRLIRKLKCLIDEYATRVGQQAIVLCCTPGKTDNNFKVFGAAPLENVVRNMKSSLMQELQEALSQQTPKQGRDNPNQFELPPLVIEGIPTPVDKMTQAQLRAFIPLMLKYSTGRGKPGWGKESCRPVWWPSDLPWANVRSDVRTEEDKRKVSWTHALRTIVKNCYKHHGREDLLPEFSEEKEKEQHTIQHASLLQTIHNEDGSVSFIQVDTGATVTTITDAAQVQQLQAMQGIPLQQIQIQQHNVGQPGLAAQNVQTLAEVAANQGVLSQMAQHGGPVTVQLAGPQRVATLATATLPAGTQIMLPNGTVGTISAVPEGFVIPASVYQTVTATVDNGEVQVMAPSFQLGQHIQQGHAITQAQLVQQTNPVVTAIQPNVKAEAITMVAPAHIQEHHRTTVQDMDASTDPQMNMSVVAQPVTMDGDSSKIAVVSMECQ